MQLVVQIKTVGEHQQSCAKQVFQKLVGIEHHRKALARTLCMPKHTDFPIIALQGFLGTLKCFLYGKILMVTGKNACFFIHSHCKSEISNNINKPVLCEDAIKESFKVSKCRTFITSVRGFPLHISVERCGNCAYPSVCHVTYHKHLASDK
nr:hypothetical protein [uncultured Alistipes sp.]